MHQMLRPGTHVLRRGAGELQVGLLPDQAVVLRDTPAVRETLRSLRATPPAGLGSPRAAAGPPSPVPDPTTLAALDAHRLLQPRRHALEVHAGDDAVAAAGLAALARDLDGPVSTACAVRARTRVELQPFGPGRVAQQLVANLTGLLGQAGLPVAAAPATERAGSAATVGVLAGIGEPDRASVHRWARAGTPHLVVRLVEGRALVGPFVDPGATACLHCVDCHLYDQDPAWPLLVEQYAAATAAGTGLPEPVDPLLSALATAIAAREVASYVDGGRPATWSAVLSVHPQLAALRADPYLRHPACGCSWADVGVASRTMGG